MKKFQKIVVCLFACCLFLTACGGSSSSTESSVSYKASYDMVAAEEAPAEEPAPAPQAMAEEAVEMETGEAGGGGLDGGSTVDSGAVESARKLIRTIDMSVETENYDALLATLQEKIRTLGGYIEQKDAFNGSQTSGALRNISMTVRIPSDRLDEFVTKVGEECNVIRESEYVEDVTLTYVDMDSHRQMLEIEQQRLLQLLEEAATIEDIIALESRLSEVRYEIESIASQLRTYDNLVDYSTVYLYIDEVERYTPVQEETDLERIRSGFAESLYQVGKNIKNFVIDFIISIPYLVVWAVVIFLIVFIVRSILRRKGGSREKVRKERGRWLPGKKKETTEESNGSQEPRL